MAPFKRTRAAAPAPVKKLEDIDAALRAVTSVLNSHDEEIGKLNGGLTLGSNTVGIVKTLSFKMPDDPPWKPVIPSASWSLAPSEPADYLMEPQGLVRLRGGLVPAAGTINPNPAGGGTATLTTMPAGYRPIRSTALPGISLAGAALQWAVHGITTAGVVNYLAGIAAATAVGFDGMQWYATQAAPPHQFDEAGWPLIVKHGFDKPCTGLVVLGFRLQGQTGQNVGAGTPEVDWQDLGDGSLRINGVWGLQWSQRYDLRLYLTPENEE